MTALADISKALADAPPPHTGKRRFVIVGRSAKLALMAEVKSEGAIQTEAPTCLGPYPILYTVNEDLPGWDIVDKPVGL